MRYRFLLRDRRQPESAALDSDVRVVRDYFLPRLGTVGSYRYPSAPGLLRHLGEPPHAVRHGLATSRRDRQPAIAVFDDPLERPRAVAANVHRRMRLLHGLRPRPEP